MDTDDMLRGMESIMSEIFTLDSTGSLQSQSISQNNILPASNIFSVGKIHRIDGASGTGFAVGSNISGPLILTCKHVALDVVTQYNVESWISFEDDQSIISLEEDDRNHQCGLFYCLILLDTASSRDDPELLEEDPITHINYSVSFDASLFQMQNICRCGAQVPYPQLTFVPLTTQLPQNQISIYGYLGELNANTVPLIDISESELDSLRVNLKKGIVTRSTGDVIQHGNLCAITCPTTAGFSGSPVVATYQNNEVKAWALFISGPALSDHMFYKRLLNYYVSDRNKAKLFIQNINPLEFPCASNAQKALLRRFSVDSWFIPFAGASYGSVIYKYRKYGFKPVIELNHNLCLPLFRIQGFLRKNLICIN